MSSQASDGDPSVAQEYRLFYRGDSYILLYTYQEPDRCLTKSQIRDRTNPCPVQFHISLAPSLPLSLPPDELHDVLGCCEQACDVSRLRTCPSHSFLCAQ